MYIDYGDWKSAAPPPPDPAGTIVLVEDERSVRIALTRELRGAGYDVEPAASAEEALARLSARPDSADLVVTDVLLPGLTGGELVQRLRSLGLGCPVLCISAQTEEALLEDGRLAPGTPFLPKPFTEEQLLAKVRGLLERRR